MRHGQVEKMNLTSSLRSTDHVVVVNEHDKNNRTVWEFYFHKNKLWLDKYTIETRKMSRSKWTWPGPRFERCSKRDSNISEDQARCPKR